MQNFGGTKKEYYYMKYFIYNFTKSIMVFYSYSFTLLKLLLLQRSVFVGIGDKFFSL